MYDTFFRNTAGKTKNIPSEELHEYLISDNQVLDTFHDKLRTGANDF
jgi:hypothetical protein